MTYECLHDLVNNHIFYHIDYKLFKLENMSQSDNGELLQGLLITGAGVLAGGAVMAAISSRSSQQKKFEFEDTN